MSTRDYIPHKDGLFLTWVKNFLAHLMQFLTTLGLHEADIEDLEKLADTFEAALAISEHPDTRTPTAILIKKEARKSLEAAVRKFNRHYITGNPDVSDAQRSAMGLPIYSNTRTPVKIPVTWPEGNTDSGKPRCIVLHYHDSGKEHLAKPKGVHGVEIRWGFSETQPVHVDNLQHSMFDTRTPCQFEFKDEERGRTVYFAMRWENTRGEKGIWSEILSAIIA